MRIYPAWWPLIMMAVVSLVALCLVGCSRCGKSSKDLGATLDEIKERGLDALRRQDIGEAFMFGDSLLSMQSRAAGEHADARIYGLVIKGQGAVLDPRHDVDALSLFIEAKELCDKTDNDFALASVYNGLGLYYLKVKRNSNLGLRYFYQGLEAARRGKNDSLYGVLLANIALTHIGNNSSIGLRYAFESYNYGKERGIDRIICAGALACADLYRQRGETALALKMVKEAEDIILANDYDEIGNLYRIYGEIMSQKGDYARAEDYMKKALEAEEPGSDIFIKVSISYAEMLMSLGRDNNALAVLKKAEKEMNSKGDNFFRILLLDALSKVCDSLGDRASALRYRTIRDQEQQQVSEAESREKIQDLQDHYDREMAENAIVRNELKLLKERQLVMILVVVIIVIVIAAIPLIVMYRRKSQLYTAIVKQTTETARSERVLRETILKMGNDLNTATGESGGQTETEAECPDETQEGDDGEQARPTLSHVKYIDILGRLEMLMLDPEIYTANDISKEKVAKIIGTNRTYLSKVINEYYGISFTKYIGNLRIKEAIRRLADTTDDTPIKKLSSDLGFNSISTFYTLFSAETGITPANYRERARRLDLGKKNEDAN